MPHGVEYRYYDQPMPGSIYTAPDILNVVRGPTLVRVRYRKEPMRVPAQIKVSKAAGNVHDHSEGVKNSSRGASTSTGRLTTCATSDRETNPSSKNTP
jgi:hypothetical protein